MTKYKKKELKFKVSKRVLQDFLWPGVIAAEEVLVTVEKKGWMYRIVDAAHILVVEAFLANDGFIEYPDVGNSKRYAVNIARVDKFLSKIKQDRTDHPLIVVLKKEDIVIKKEHSTYRCNYADENCITDPKMLGLKLPVRGIVAVDQLKEMRQSIADSTDEFVITVGKSIVVSWRGENESYELDAGQVENNDGKEAKARYDAGYLGRIIKVAEECKVKEIGFSMGNDFPIKVHFKKGEMEVAMVMAPRIDC